jgi:hypothetical protein
MRPYVCTLGALTGNAMLWAHAQQQEPSRRTKSISGRQLKLEYFYDNENSIRLASVVACSV